MRDAAFSRAPWRRWLISAVALALPALATPAAAQTVTELSISPAAPTWRESVQLTIAGTLPSSCIPITPPPAIVVVAPGTYRIDLSLAIACPPGSFGSYAFSADVDLGPLDPGSYTLRVLEFGATTLAQKTFDVFDVGDAVVELPAVSTANHPGLLRLTWLAGAGAPAATVEAHGSLVEVHVSSPGGSALTQLVSLDVPLPLLVTGRNELRIFLPPRSMQMPRLVRSELHVLRPAGCVPDSETLCLHDGRFRVTATWRDFIGRTGVGHSAPLHGNDGSGLLWFFGPENTELTVKVLDGCVISQRWWTFVSSNSTVEYTLTVTDVPTGRTRTYTNELGQVPRLIDDTDAFPCDEPPVSGPAR